MRVLDKNHPKGKEKGTKIQNIKNIVRNIQNKKTKYGPQIMHTIFYQQIHKSIWLQISGCVAICWARAACDKSWWDTIGPGIQKQS